MLWAPTILIALGILLVFIEILVLPGFGAAGVPGIILLIVGIGMIWSRSGITIALIYASLALIFVIPIAVIGLSLFRETPIGKTFILNAVERSDEGFQAAPQELTALVGKSGTAVTPLRPAGVALINGQRVDIVTQGEFVAPETEVEVIQVEGSRVVVRSL
jgi:membrane-bound serine protease (ClpP class)